MRVAVSRAGDSARARWVPTSWVPSSVANRPWATWFLTRGLGLALGGLAFAATRGNVYFDTSYYAHWAHGTLNGSRIPYRDFAWEYPPAALPAMLLPAMFELILRGNPADTTFNALYGAIWVALMLSADAAIFAFLRRRVGRQARELATTAWLYGLPLLGALTWTRYDLLPAATSLITVLAAGTGAAKRSGRLAGLGGALKIWPVLLAPVQRTRRGAVTAMLGCVSVMALAAASTFLLSGETGFAQVLHYQTRRGLQIESVAALPLVWFRHLHVGGYVAHTRFGAVQIDGPGALVLSRAVTGLYAVGLGALACAHWRFMRNDAGRRLVALTAMGVMLLTIVTNKVFSPQYLLWLIAVLTAACLLDPATWRPYLGWVLLACGLTAVEFPWLYGDVTGTAWLGLIVLTARDVVVIGLSVAVCRRVVAELGELRRADGSRRPSTHGAPEPGQLQQRSGLVGSRSAPTA